MNARVRRDRIEVHHDSAPEVVRDDAAPITAPAPPAPSVPLADDEIPYVEPEEYGVRVTWQSEAVRIEAAEFLVATRVQEASRRRLAGRIARLRAQLRAERGA